jgi:hypothetical protein
MRRTNKTSRASGLLAAKGKKAEGRNRFKLVSGGGQGLEQGSEREAARQVRSAKCCLTLHSRGGPTACHQAPAGSTVYIVAVRGLASHRWPPLSSNVRPRIPQNCGYPHLLKTATCIKVPATAALSS